jgi:hypothetical protein
MFIFVTLFLPRGLMGLATRRRPLPGRVDAAVAAQEEAMAHEAVAAREAVE